MERINYAKVSMVIGTILLVGCATSTEAPEAEDVPIVQDRTGDNDDNESLETDLAIQSEKGSLACDPWGSTCAPINNCCPGLGCLSTLAGRQCCFGTSNGLCN